MINLKQEVKLSPQLIITPQLKLYLKLLQLNTLELEEYLIQEVQKNPFLEIEYKDLLPEGSKEEVREETKLSDEFGEDDYYLLSEGYHLIDFAESEEEPLWEKLLRSEQTLTDHLLWQLKLKNMKGFDYKIAEYIIGNLDERGYLKIPVDELAKTFKCSIERVEKVRREVRFLDPVGIGSLNLKECLLTQLEAYGYTEEDLVYRLVKEHLKELEKGIEYLASTYNFNKEELEEALEIIRGLEPYPARNFADITPTFVEPDLEFKKTEEGWKVELTKDLNFRIKINPKYKALLQEIRNLKIDKKDKKFLKEKLKQAQDLLKALDSRYSSLYKVGRAILEEQIDFLEKGIKFLKPLNLKKISERTGLHESTISRIVNSKYVQTPSGVYPLKFFFSAGYTTEDGGGVSSRGVKEFIKEIIEKEDKRKPLSDRKISEILEKEYGVKVARRTVAKYREELGIPSASKRKVTT